MARKSTAKVISVPDVFRATGAQLRAAAESGNAEAQAEMARRKAKRASTAES